MYMLICLCCRMNLSCFYTFLCFSVFNFPPGKSVCLLLSFPIMMILVDYSCRIHMAPFSDEYLYVEIANKVCSWMDLLMNIHTLQQRLVTYYMTTFLGNMRPFLFLPSSSSLFFTFLFFPSPLLSLKKFLIARIPGLSRPSFGNNKTILELTWHPCMDLRSKDTFLRYTVDGCQYMFNLDLTFVPSRWIPRFIFLMFWIFLNLNINLFS